MSGFLAIGQAQAAGQCPVHRLTVTQIKTIAPDAGISTIGGILLSQLADATGVADVINAAGYAAYAADHFVFDTNFLEPDTEAGWDAGLALISSATSGQDDLIVQINGTTIVPGPAQVFHEGDWGAALVAANPGAGVSTGIYQPMFKDSRLIPDTLISFFEFGTLRLIGYDEGGIFASESDGMGAIIFGARTDQQISQGTLSVVRDCFEPGIREALMVENLDDSVVEVR